MKPGFSTANPFISHMHSSLGYFLSLGLKVPDTFWWEGAYRAEVRGTAGSLVFRLALIDPPAFVLASGSRVKEVLKTA